MKFLLAFLLHKTLNFALSIFCWSMKAQSKFYFNFSLNLLFPFCMWKCAVRSMLAGFQSLSTKAFRLSINLDLAGNQGWNSLRQLPLLSFLLMGLVKVLFSSCYCFLGPTPSPHPRFLLLCRVPSQDTRSFCLCLRSLFKERSFQFSVPDEQNHQYSAMARNKSWSCNFWDRNSQISPYILYNS